MENKPKIAIKPKPIILGELKERKANLIMEKVSLGSNNILKKDTLNKLSKKFMIHLGVMRR
jgi:hypothetical protein